MNGIPARYRDACFEDFPGFEPFPEGDEEGDRWVERFGETPFNVLDEGPGWFIHGEPGTGKTHLACAIVRDAARLKVPAAFVTVAEYLDTIKRSWTGDEASTAALDRLANVRLLALDDLGAEHPTPWSESELTTLVDLFYRKNRNLVVTSNYELARLGYRYQQRLIGRLAEHCRVWHMEGEDRRLAIRSGIERSVPRGDREEDLPPPGELETTG